MKNKTELKKNKRAIVQHGERNVNGELKTSSKPARQALKGAKRERGRNTQRLFSVKYLFREANMA